MKRSYRRRNELGDSTPRCRWCGRPIEGKLAFLRSDGTDYWCSAECNMAGNMYLYSACAILMAIIIIITGVALWVSATQVEFNPMGLGIALIFELAILGFVLKRAIIGRSIRLYSDGISVSPSISEKDLSPLQRELLVFIREFPANMGVRRQDIESHFREKGYLLAHIGMGLRDLVEGGLLEQTSYGYYNAVR